MLEEYILFLENLDKQLAEYNKLQKDFIICQKGCSSCCEKGDYPLSELEMKYLMQGYIELDNRTKIKIQNNIQCMQKGEKCPFLIDNMCSVYKFRPIICRTHGLAYIYKNNVVKVPYCANNGKNYSKAYKNGELFCEPIKKNLETTFLLKDFKYGEIHNLYDWIKA